MTEKSSKKVFNPKLAAAIAGCFLLVAIITACLGRFIALSNSEHPISELDLVAPEVILNGEATVTLTEGSTFEDPGATATDNGTEIDVVVSGHVNTSAPASYLISYTAADAAGNIGTATRIVSVTPKSRGVIYLTFDDGPGAYTAELLDILKKYGVKATFFVTGAGDDSLIAREYNEGHAIGLHTFSHNYAYLYTSVDNFFADLYKIQERVKNITGYTSYLMRFPGGSSNTVSARYDGGQRIMTKLADEVTARGFTYFDWNITSGDAGGTTDSTTVYYNVINRVYPDGSSVVLQHDIKGFSVAAVERIIQWGLANGYSFKKLDASSPTAHHRVNN